jgi:hypothetical protein
MKKIEALLEKILITTCSIILLVIFLEISFIGKNLTYTTRFTPPSTEDSIRNQTYYTEVQVIIIVTLILYAFYIPIFVYVTFTKSKRYFFPLWICFIIFNSVIILFNIYYLVGFKNYRRFLSQL